MGSVRVRSVQKLKRHLNVDAARGAKLELFLGGTPFAPMHTADRGLSPRSPEGQKRSQITACEPDLLPELANVTWFSFLWGSDKKTVRQRSASRDLGPLLPPGPRG